jgi:hypothetical protein
MRWRLHVTVDSRAPILPGRVSQQVPSQLSVLQQGGREIEREREIEKERERQRQTERKSARERESDLSMEDRYLLSMYLQMAGSG